MARKIKDDDDNETVGSAAAEIAAELAQNKGKRVTENTASDEVEVDLDEDEEEDDDIPVRTAEEVRSRNDRRRDRYRANKETAEYEKRRADAAEERERQATLRADAMALHFRQQNTQTPDADPLDKEIEQAEAEKKRMWDDMLALPAEAQLESARYAEFTKRSQEADRKIYSLVARKEMRQHAQPAAPSIGRIIATTQFPDVMEHPEGSRRTDALLQYKWAMGEPQNEKTLVAALTEVRQQLRTGGPRRDVQSLKSKLGHSSASRGSAGPAPERRVVKLDVNMRKLAKATYKGQGLTEEQMFKKFAREHMGDD